MRKPKGNALGPLIASPPLTGLRGAQAYLTSAPPEYTGPLDPAMTAPPRRSLASRLVTALMLWYARHVPYHRGKTRASGWLRRRFGVAIEGVVVERREGLQWCFDRGDDMCQDLYWSGAQDRAEIAEALRALPPGGVMLDVGANFGYYAITLAARRRQECTIHAFEPSRLLFERLCKNLELTGTRAVTAHRLGLSDREGMAGVVEVPGQSGDTHLRPGNDVAVTSLDRFAEHARLERLDFVKIDVEGAELRILEGGRATLERFRPAILLELNAPTLAREHALPGDVLSLLRRLGYRIYSVTSKRELTGDAGPRPVMNVLCVADEARVG
jgi:FkbM family methyltransferase